MKTGRIDRLAIRAVLVQLAILTTLLLPLILAACGPGSNGGGGGPGSGY
jgi:hypothetical protein